MTAKPRRRLKVKLSRPAHRMIDTLLRTGLYGKSRAEVAQRLIYEGLQRCELLSAQRVIRKARADART